MHKIFAFYLYEYIKETIYTHIHAYKNNYFSSIY